MYPQYMFEQKYEFVKKNSTENCHFYSCEKSLYIGCAFFRNEVESKQRQGTGTIRTKFCPRILNREYITKTCPCPCNI